MKPRVAIVLGYLGTILLGAVLLTLPVSSPSHTWMNFGDALFTACSGVCITGLSVIDVGRDLSVFGQVVLLVLVQLGCVGIMTAGTFLLVVAGRRVSLAGEFSIMTDYGASGVKGFRGLVVWVVTSMLAIEALGAAALWAFAARGGDWEAALLDGELWYKSFYRSAMAFCNAGFSIDAGSLASFASSPAVLLTMSVLVVLGGFGFLVIYNLCSIKFWRRSLVRRGRLSLHSRVVLAGTFFLTVFGFFMFCALEWNGALEPFDWSEKPAIALFQAITPRTCGFTVVPMEELSDAARFFSEVMMFVGAAPGGAGGGIKITTLVVFLWTLLAIYRGRRDTVIFKRTVPETVVREAMVIVVVLAAMVTLGMTVLLMTERGSEALTFERLLFETVSAVSTTGLSCGDTTASLSAAGRAVIMVCMFAGRLGALAIVTLIGGQEEQISVRYPKEALVVG